MACAFLSTTYIATDGCIILVPKFQFKIWILHSSKITLNFELMQFYLGLWETDSGQDRTVLDSGHHLLLPNFFIQSDESVDIHSSFD